jgi:hypothetical protein
MQECTLGLSMWEHGNTSHYWLDGISINDTILDAWNKERRLAALEVVVEVDEEREERGLARIGRRRVVLVGVCNRINA